MIGLDSLKGIKPRQIKILQEHGINSVESLAMSVPEELAELDGISEKMGKKLVWEARDYLGLGAFKCVAEIEEKFEYITTGSKRLDAILTPPGKERGGISTGRITEVFGAFKSGKTNLAHTLCVTVQLPPERGGLGGAVLFIDTENTFSKSKIKRIARRFGLNPKEVLSNIYHARIYSSDHQLQMIMAAEAAIQEKGARLIIIDSLMALLRSEYIGIGLLAKRQQLLNKIIHELSRLAETYNVAVLVTNQVATVMKGTFASEDAIGGNIVAHGCHFRIMFKAKGFSSNTSLERTAVIVDAPDLPPESTTFYITEAGIADSEVIEYPEEVEETAEESKTRKFKLISADEEEDMENDENISELAEVGAVTPSNRTTGSKKKSAARKRSTGKKSSTKKKATVGS